MVFWENNMKFGFYGRATAFQPCLARLLAADGIIMRGSVRGWTAKITAGVTSSVEICHTP